MSFFKKRSTETVSLSNNWINLSTVEQVNQAIADSNNKPIAFFKHSVTCGISAAANYKLESELDLRINDVDFYYLDLLAHRDVSNFIAQKLGIIHQSPQVIVVKNGEVVYHTSHHAINALELAKAI